MQRVLLVVVLGVVTTAAMAWGLPFVQWVAHIAGQRIGGIEPVIGCVYDDAGRAIAFRREGFWSSECSYFAEVKMNDPSRLFSVTHPVPAPRWAAALADSVNFGIQTREQSQSVSVTACGWPFRCLGAVLTTTYSTEGSSASPAGRISANFGYVPLRWKGYSYSSIDYLPYWPGLLANIAIYVIVWALPLTVWHWLQRTLRKRWNRCVGCNYDRVGLGRGYPCPECGGSS